MTTQWTTARKSARHLDRMERAFIRKLHTEIGSDPMIIACAFGTSLRTVQRVLASAKAGTQHARAA